jgi:hypothetical protein
MKGQLKNVEVEGIMVVCRGQVRTVKQWCSWGLGNSRGSAGLHPFWVGGRQVEASDSAFTTSAVFRDGIHCFPHCLFCAYFRRVTK